MKSARGISFDCRPSGTLTRVTLVIVALAAAAPLFTSLGGFVRWPLAVGIAAYGLRRVAKCRRPAVAALVWATDGVWTITDPHGEDWPAELAGSRTVGVSVFLHLRWADGAGHVALLSDNTHPDDLRMLRARLAQRA